jgi:hypothetical protein
VLKRSGANIACISKSLVHIDLKTTAPGNYIFSRRNGNMLYPVYIGEGMIKDRIVFRINEGKIQEKGCTCVSVRLLNDGEDSKQIEEDLLAVNPLSYEPTGCNIKQGG